MRLTIETSDSEFAKELTQSAPGIVRVARSGAKSIGGYDLIILILDFVKSHITEVEIALFVTWLCAKCKERPCKIKDRGRDIEPSEPVVRRWIQEELDIDDKKQGDK